MYHTFVICAYKESQYLGESVEALLSQTVKSSLICATSTPNEFISAICQKYNIELRVNPIRKSIGADWNFAYNQAQTEFVTLAHQDDIYEKNYLEQSLIAMNKNKNAAMVFSDYYEIRNKKRINSNQLLRIKRFLNTPYRIPIIKNITAVTKIPLYIADPIIIPSAMYRKSKMPLDFHFNEKYSNSMDWLACVELMKARKKFVYIPQMLLGHRIHVESETTNSIFNNSRSSEDLSILRMLWPKPIADMIFKFYVKGQKSNKI